jgi:hypothetical protein
MNVFGQRFGAIVPCTLLVGRKERWWERKERHFCGLGRGSQEHPNGPIGNAGLQGGQGECPC